MKKQFDVWRFNFPKKGEHSDIYDLRFTIDDYARHAGGFSNRKSSIVNHKF